MADETAGTQPEGSASPLSKHPLEQAWTLWFDNPQAKQSTNRYGQTLKEVFTFNTVEDFWW
jgi:translation initiation factor 4E